MLQRMEKHEDRIYIAVFGQVQLCVHYCKGVNGSFVDSDHDSIDSWECNVKVTFTLFQFWDLMSIYIVLGLLCGWPRDLYWIILLDIAST